MVGEDVELSTSRTGSLAMRTGTDGWVRRGWREGTATLSEAYSSEIHQRQRWELRDKGNLLLPRSLCSRIRNPNGRHNLWLRKLNRRIHSETSHGSGGSWPRLRVLVSLANVHLPALVMGYVAHARWKGLLTQSWAHRSRINWWKSSTWASEPTGRLWHGPTTFGLGNLKSSPPNQSSFLPTTCISDIFRLGRATSAPFEQADEEAGMRVKEEREQQTGESLASHSRLLQKPSPLSAMRTQDSIER